MIDSKDLRIGNYAIDNDNQIIQVSFKTFELLNDLDTYYLNPIPLTEEILLKCGFENKRRYLDRIIFQDVLIIFRFYITIRHDGSFSYDWNGGSTQIKDLHQLQNLYYCLTGKELEVKL